MKATILLIDDGPVDLKVLQSLVESRDYAAAAVRSGREGLDLLKMGGIDLVISDVRMPHMSGVEVAAEAARDYPGIPVILVTAHADVRSAVDAMKRGAYDYVTKPADETELLLAIEHALEHSLLKKENAFLRSELAVGGPYGERLIGGSPAMQEVYSLITRVAPTDSTVLLCGETGTGKELAAQTIHFRSSRAGKPFVAVNCAAVNQGVTESELFGHEKGAFTGAVAARRGRFEDADGGTLFLDEITEAAPDFQAKLLRVLQEGVLQRVGGNRDIRVDVRVIASTNRDIESAVRQGKFREDLYFRLNVVPIVLPPLRERVEDIPVLADHFLQAFRKRYESRAKSFSKDAYRYLSSLEWKGNVRELAHAVERAVVLAVSEELGPGDFSRRSTVSEAGKPDLLEDVLDQCTREHILAVLEKTGWRKQRAAALLGIDRATLYRLIRKLGLES